MSFVLPTFNLTVNVWRNGNPTFNSPDLSPLANLALGRRVGLDVPIDYYGSSVKGLMWLLCPIGTDIRDDKAPGGEDTVEAPAGSQRFYRVVWVDDIGGGFSNEHRFAMLAGLGPWPVPFPKCVGPYPPPPPPPLVIVGQGHATQISAGISWSSFTGGSGDAIVYVLSDSSTGGVTLSGNPNISGANIGLAGPPSRILQVFHVSGAGGGGSGTLAPSFAPPSWGAYWVVFGIQRTVSAVKSETFVTGSGSPSHTPSGWVPPPTSPTLEIPCVTWLPYSAGSFAFGAPYSGVLLGGGGGLLAPAQGTGVGVTQVSSLTYPPWSISGTGSSSWAGGTILAG